MSQVDQLYKLQQYDSEIHEKKKRLGEVLQLQKGNPTLNAARKRHETAVADFQQKQGHHQDLTLELAGLNTKAKNSEERLYSGKVKNPKELADLQEEVASLGRRRTALEEELLALMLQVEEAEAEKTAAEDDLLDKEASWELETAGLKQEQNELALRLHHIMGLRKSYAETIPANVLREYNVVAKRKGVVAVSKVRINTCLSCQIDLPDRKVYDAKSGKIVHCGGCGRIIYIAS